MIAKGESRFVSVTKKPIGRAVVGVLDRGTSTPVRAKHVRYRVSQKTYPTWNHHTNNHTQWEILFS